MNRRFLELNAGTEAYLGSGHRYEDHLRAGQALGVYPDAMETPTAWLEMVARRRRNPEGPREVRRGTTVQWLSHQRLPDGSMITYSVDITQRKQAEEALKSCEAILAHDARSDPRTAEFTASYLVPLGITAMMDIPIILYGDLRGVLCHEQVGEVAPWTPEDRLFGSALANLINLALERRERSRVEQALRDARDLADAGSRTKSQFLANMSHEIRTPMNGVMGMAELLLRTRLDHKQRSFAQRIHRSGSALLGVIDDILDFSKIEAGRLTLEVTTTPRRSSARSMRGQPTSCASPSIGRSSATASGMFFAPPKPCRTSPAARRSLPTRNAWHAWAVGTGTSISTSCGSVNRLVASSLTRMEACLPACMD